MAEAEENTLIWDIRIHAIYEPGKMNKYLSFHLEQFGVIYNIRDIVEKEMLKYYVVSFKHDPIFSSCRIVQRWGFALDGLKCIYTSWIRIQLIEDAWTC